MKDAPQEAFKITLRERGKAILQTNPDFDILLNGSVFGQLTYNMTGYIGYLPLPEGGKMDFGETGIAAYRRAIASLNREARSKDVQHDLAS